MDRDETARKLLDAYGTPFHEELGIGLDRNEPMPLFRWLVTANLFAGRIRYNQAMEASRALWERDWQTPEKFAEADEDQRAEVLGYNGYGEYANQAARQLGDMTRQILDDFDGDLRKLRAAAEGDPSGQRKLLKKFKGIGDTGADVFFKEAQAVWTEHRPFVDDVAADGAERFGLPKDGEALAGLVDEDAFVPLIAALTRVSLEDLGPDDLD